MTDDEWLEKMKALNIQKHTYAEMTDDERTRYNIKFHLNGEQKPYAEMTEAERTRHDIKQSYDKKQTEKRLVWQPEAKPEREKHYCQLCDKQLQEWRYNSYAIPELCGAWNKDKGKEEEYEKIKELQRQSAISRAELGIDKDSHQA